MAVHSRCLGSFTTFAGALAIVVGLASGCAQDAAQYAPFGLGDFPVRVGLSTSAHTVVMAQPARGAFPQGELRGGGPNGRELVSSSFATDNSSCMLSPRSDELRAQVIDLVNRERQARGLRPLRRNAVLEAQADAYACEMIQYGFFGHDNPVNGSNLRTRNAQFGYPFRLIGENLAAGQQTPREAMVDWMNSPTHRENLLNPNFQEIGIGIRIGGDYGIYWVQEFGQPAPLHDPRPAQSARFARG